MHLYICVFIREELYRRIQYLIYFSMIVLPRFAVIVHFRKTLSKNMVRLSSKSSYDWIKSGHRVKSS